MIADGERPEGTIRVYFIDNTYKTLPLKNDTPVNDVVECLCKRLSGGGRLVEPSRHELFIIAPGNQTLRERKLQREDKPLQIQAEGGSRAFKFLFREVPLENSSGDNSAAQHGQSSSLQGGSAAAAFAAAMPGAAATGGAAESVPVADVSGAIRTGALECLAHGVGPDGSPEASAAASWYKCTVVLMEDRLWYSQGPHSRGGVGGGMASVALCDCDKVMECDDKRQLKLITKGGTMTLRARTGSERSSWLLAIAKQAAFVKERGILDEAERIITSIEFKRSTRQLSKLEALGQLDGVLATKETRELFFGFARSEHEKAQVAWPADLSLEAFVGCLELQVTSDAAGADEVMAWNFAESVLFPRFQEHPQSQMRLCRIAAGIPVE